MRTPVILNEKAGTLAASQDIGATEIDAEFARAGRPVRTLVAPAGGLAPALRAAIAERPPVVFVGGGDGTLSLAAGLLADTGIALGPLPLGTLNHFAKDLGVPTDWREAVAALAQAPVREVDVGEVNGRVFLNNCSLGVYAEAVRERDALRRRHGFGKWRAMTLASWKTFRRLRRMRLEIATREGATPLRTPILVMSNNRYSGHVLDGSVRARLDEGALWLHTTRLHQHFPLLRLVLQALRRRLDEVDHLETRSLTEATITTRSTVPIAIDGELVPLEAPLRFRVRPRALRVLAPPPKRP